MGKYCTFYLICQGDRVIHREKLKDFQSLPISMKILNIFSMDFIIGLSENVKYGGIHNVILVVIDKHSKIFHKILCHSETTEGDHVEVITQEVI